MTGRKIVRDGIGFDLASSALALARRLRISLSEDLFIEMALLAAHKVRKKLAFAGDESSLQLLAMPSGRRVVRLQRHGALGLRHFDANDQTFSCWECRRHLADALTKTFNAR